jgi:hypothetical protein
MVDRNDRDVNTDRNVAERDGDRSEQLQNQSLIGHEFLHRESGARIRVDSIDGDQIHWTVVEPDQKLRGQKSGLMSLIDFKRQCDLESRRKAA